MYDITNKGSVLIMETENLPADGYYDEGTTAPKEDFDLSFLDEDESEEE